MTTARSWRARLAAWSDVHGLWALLVLIARVPRVGVRPTDTPAGRAIEAHLRFRNARRPPTNRLLQSALLLPASKQLYTRGRSRHALRTNVRRAEALGLSCQRITGLDTEALLRYPWLRDSPHRALLNETDGRNCWIVLDPFGDPVGLGLAVVDRDVALLLVVESSISSARWLLNLRITEALIDAGVSVLLVNDHHVLQLRPAVRYLHRLLGYSVVHVSLERGPRIRRYAVAVLRRLLREVVGDGTVPSRRPVGRS